MVHHQAYQHMLNGSHRRKGERERKERILDNNNLKLPKFDKKYINLHIKKAQQAQAG